jgi:hypothetical protein
VALKSAQRPAELSNIENMDRKRQLFDDLPDSDDGGAPLDLKVNEEFAKRFEHNKKREEKQRRKSFIRIVFQVLKKF